MSDSDEKPEISATFARKLLDCHENFKATGNGLYAWAAIYLCLNGESELGQKLPEWLRTYLLESALGLRFLASRLNAVTRPKREEFGSDENAYIAAMGVWGQKTINFTQAAELAPVLLKLKPDHKKAEAKGKNFFLNFATDMEGYSLNVLRDKAGYKGAVKISQSSDLDYMLDEARNVRKLMKRGKERASNVTSSRRKNPSGSDDTVG